MSKRSSQSRRPTAPRGESVESKPSRTHAPYNPSAALHREIITKRRGEIAELTFSLKAYHLGFGVSKPYGDSERYDVILDARELKARRNKIGDVGLLRTGSRTIAIVGGVRELRHIVPRFPSPPLWRVQVKCTTSLVDGLYKVDARRRSTRRGVPYLPGEIDFLAAYIVPEDTWYIVPLGAFLGSTGLLFRRRDDPRPGLYDAYREAWQLLRPDLTVCGKCGANTLLVE